MRPLLLTHVAVIVSATTLGAQLAIHPEELKLKPKIDNTIGLGVESLLDRQLRDGSWGVHAHVGGRAGLCAYALLKCGVGMDHPAMRRVFAFLDNVRPTKTYAVACMMLAYGEAGDAHNDRLQELLDQLLKWQRPRGDWAYPGGATDLSNTQYAALGLWVASKSGLKVPSKVWNKLIEATLRYREEPHLIDVKISKRTGVGKLQVAGFGYRSTGRGGHRKCTGSMTTAGVSILKICEIGLGKNLRARARTRINDGIEGGINWLDAKFSVNTNPGKGGGWLLYYLYGMERVGSLTRKEKFGDHFWYLEGARHLIKKQKKGSWGNETDSCFALLFLRRATNFNRPTTGGGSSSKTKLFSAGGAKDDIALRGAGQQPLAIYIDRFGKRLLQEHSEYGLRILRVEYRENGRKLGELVSDPKKAWKNDTFLYRCAALPRGPHTIVAHVIAIAPNAPMGNTSETVTIKSKPMKVSIRDIFEPWMVSAASMQLDNLLRGVRVAVTASSNPKNAKHVADGKDNTVWLSAPKDAATSLTLVFPRSIKARRMVLTQALVRDDDRARIGVIKEIEVSWNKSKNFVRIKMHEDPLAPTEYELKKLRSLRHMTIRVVSRSGKAGLPVGFAEITLAAKRRRK